jgi:ATP-binding cassette, subfamily C, bacteriocin exporter
MSVKQLRKVAEATIELQQNESDCGIAALASIIQFHGGYVPLENLRTLSGASATGTTMLGLLQAGDKVGFVSEAYEGSIEDLKEVSYPSILHITKHGHIEHFIVCYIFDGENFLVGDPESGIKLLSSEELEGLWKSKAVLILKKNDKFILRSKIKKAKYKWLFESLSGDINFLSSTIIIGIMISLLNFSTAIFIEKLIDNLIPSKQPVTIVLGICAWLFFMIMKSLFNYLRELLLIEQSFRFNIRLTGDFIQKLMELPKPFFDSRKKGDLIARLFDTGRVQKSISTIVGQDIVDVLTLICAIIFVIFYDSNIAIFLGFLIPSYFFIIRNFHSNIYSTNKDLMASYALNEASYIDTLTGVEAIKQCQKEVSEANSLIDNFKGFQNNAASVERVNANFKISTDSFGILAVFFVLTYCVTSVMRNSIQIGDMMAIFSISTIALASTNRLAYAITHLQEAKVALDRTYDIVSLKPENKSGADVSHFNEIKLKNISFAYPGHDLLFEEINLSIRVGEITLLVGDNGTGKSTVLQILQKFISPQSGVVFIDEMNINDISTVALRKSIGVVPQNIKIFNQSIKFNICLSQDTPDEHVLSFCEEYELGSFINSFRDGLSTIVGEEGVNISGGQKQLIALARALYNKPKFLLLDEFTSSMDKETQRFALKLLFNLKPTTGVFIISHDHRMGKIASVAYQLINGKIEDIQSI